MTEKSARHGGDIFGLSPKERKKVLDFSININPLGLSPKGKKALKRGWIENTVRYPDVEARDLVSALSARYGMARDSIAVGNGATELMYTLLSLLKPAKVLVPAPGFSEYRLSAEAAGCPVESFRLDPADGFSLPLEWIGRELTEGSLIYLGNPNNPDGQLLKSSSLAKILAWAEEREAYVVVDESFIDFAGDKWSCRQLVKDHPRLITLMSLTKFYAVPGLRIGCSFQSPEMTEWLKSRLIPWNVNGLSQLYMAIAVKDRKYAGKTRKFCTKERKKLVKAMEKIPALEILPGSVNFILCRLEDKFETAAGLQEALKPYDIFIRQCGNYEGLDDTYFRVAVRTKEENRKLVKALQEVLGRGQGVL